MNDQESKGWDRFKCHKEVEAIKIKEIVPPKKPTNPDQNLYYMIIPERQGIGCVSVLPDWVEKHNPEVGGYVVEYNDGYRSYSPAKAFEEGYTRI